MEDPHAKTLVEEADPGGGVLSCTHPSRVWHIPLSMTEGILIPVPHSAWEGPSLRQTLLPDSQGSWEVAGSLMGAQLLL